MEIKQKQVEKICKSLNTPLINFEFLSRGCHNESFIINTQEGKIVLRVENNLQFKNLKKEYIFLKKTQGKFGPKVFLFDDSHKILNRDYLIEEFIEGKHPEKMDKNLTSLMAKWYKDLHKIKTSKKFNLKKSYENHALKEYKKFRGALDKEYLFKMDNIYEKTLNLILENKALFSKIKKLSLNHGDPTRSNIFYVGNNIKLIDWEFVRFDLLEYDLVFFIWSYELNKSQKNDFLKKYGYPKTKNAERKLNLIMLIHILSMISWRIHRLSLVYEKKIDTNQYCSTKEEIYKEIYNNIPKINALFSALK